MCIAIMKSANKKISKSTLRRCYDANPDGAGFMYAEDKQLVVKKGYFTFKEFYKEYRPHGDKQVLIHFRIKTHGPIDKNNCHPFLVNSGLGFIHNGIISGYGSNSKSDTIEFNESILQKIVAKHGNNSLFDDPMVELIENIIGYSKLVFLDRHGNYKIMNENKGAWNNGVWYSNNSWKKPEPVKHTNFLSHPYQRYNTPSNHHKVGDWVMVSEDYWYGTGDSTVVIEKDEWLEVAAYDDIKETYTLITSDIKDPLIYSDMPQKVVDDWEDVETNNWNKTFDFAR
jgi:hypothetical protein